MLGTRDTVMVDKFFSPKFPHLVMKTIFRQLTNHRQCGEYYNKLGNQGLEEISNSAKAKLIQKMGLKAGIGRPAVYPVVSQDLLAPY